MLMPPFGVPPSQQDHAFGHIRRVKIAILRLKTSISGMNELEELHNHGPSP